jgi:hypothetical protein
MTDDVLGHRPGGLTDRSSRRISCGKINGKHRCLSNLLRVWTIKSISARSPIPVAAAAAYAYVKSTSINAACGGAYEYCKTLSDKRQRLVDFRQCISVSAIRVSILERALLLHLTIRSRNLDVPACGFVKRLEPPAYQRKQKKIQEEKKTKTTLRRLMLMAIISVTQKCRISSRLKAT